MTIVDISYNHHGACGCAYYQQHDATPEVPIIRGIEASEVVDRILAMRRQEESDAYQVADYLSSSLPMASLSREDELDLEFEIDIDPACRSKMAEWFYQLVDFCRVDRDNVATAMSYLDRFLSLAHSGNCSARRCVGDRQEYQLAAMTCLYLAVNLTETREMDPSLLVELSHGKYAKSDFVTMAEHITFGLGWRLNGPTNMGFVNHFLGLLPPQDAKTAVYEFECCRRLASARDDAALHDLCRVQAELAVSDYRLASSRPSDVAVAAARNAMEQVRPQDLPALLRSLEAMGMEPLSREVDGIRSILKSVFASNADGLRQVTSLVRLGEQETSAPEDYHQPHVTDMKCSSITNSARCVTEVTHIQNRDKLRREIGEGATP
mmetsp:Transcript_33535/g.99929  ORF Transcript_33535/g.99929 Transcript_33535/m.99929 type:complete len:379 (-) Transcript_33535:193-1329(-)